MTKELTIVEGNKAIMFFDGAEESEIEIMGKMVPSIKYKKSYYNPQVSKTWPRFNEDWNLLMPVVQKIVKIACDLPTIELRKEARKRYEPIEDQLCNFLINGVHYYSVQFIQWYNQTQTP